MSIQTDANAGASDQFKPADLVVPTTRMLAIGRLTEAGKSEARFPDHAIGGTRDDPDEGEKVADVFYRIEPHPQAPKLAPDSNGLISLPDEAFGTAFAQNASAEDRAVLAAVRRPISLSCITVPVGRPLWKDIPSWFLVAEADRMIVPETQRYMAERMKAEVRAHAVDHTPSVTAPNAVVDVIRAAIRSVSGS